MSMHQNISCDRGRKSKTVSYSWIDRLTYRYRKNNAVAIKHNSVISILAWRYIPFLNIYSFICNFPLLQDNDSSNK